MKSKYCQFIILFLTIMFFESCQKNLDLNKGKTDIEIRDSLLNAWDSMMIAHANDLVHTLVGHWSIDTVEIQYKNSYGNKQAGIYSDTVIVNFGQINFGKWELLTGSYEDSTSYKNSAELIYNNKIFPVRFNYLLHNPGTDEIYSFLDIKNLQEDDCWDTKDGLFLYYSGLFDNIQIVKINQKEYYFKGINHGVKKVKLSKK